jgi:hypothetical protein
VKINSSEPQIRDSQRIDRAKEIEGEQLDLADTASVAGHSQDHADIGSVAQHLLSSGSSPESKIQDLRRLFEAGRYEPDPNNVSEKIVDSLFD